MSPSRLFILRPVATSLLTIGLLLVGIVAYQQLPVSALPEVDYPTIQVMTFYPGADPDVMTSSVTSPLERQFGQVPGLSQMTSTSSSGSSIITLQFNLDQNIDVAEQEVQAAIISAARSAQPAYLQQSKPRRCAHPYFRAYFRHSSSLQGRRSRRHATGAEDFSVVGRGIGLNQWWAKARGSHPGQPNGAGVVWSELRGPAHRPRPGQRRSGQGGARWPAAVIHHRRQ